jgi:hypothetical protein
MILFLAVHVLLKGPTIRLSEIPIKNHEYPSSFRIILDGKKTALVLENAAMNERAWVKQTTTGLIYGEALADFSGAISGTRTLCFAKYHGKLYSKKDYETKFGRGDSVIFSPFQQSDFKDSREAFLFTRGKFFSLGQVYEITGWSKQGIVGNIFVYDTGLPFSGPFNFDVPFRVYKQDFVIHGGKRTLLEKTLVYRGA